MRRVASEDSLRLYEPAGYPHPAHLPHHAAQEYPRYAATTQPMYATAAGGGGAMSAHAHTHVAHHPHATSLGLGLMGGPERRLAYPASTVGMGDTYGHAAHGTPGGSPQGYGGPPIYLPTPGSQGGEAEGAGEQQLVGAAEQPLHHDGQEDQRNGRYFAESTV